MINQTESVLGTKVAEKSNPFAALIAVSSLFAALLYVAGFAFRWSYYYNFGVQHLVFKLGFQSFLIAALELIRTPFNIGRIFLSIVVPVLVLNLILSGLRKAETSEIRVAKNMAAPFRWIGLQSPLIVDLLRAAVIVYATYHVASSVGYETFQSHLRNDPRNPLPAVTAVLDASHGSASLVLGCGAALDASTPIAFVGNARRLQELRELNRTCNSRDRITWRLLYRDDQEVYLFAAEPAVNLEQGKRPLTLILPNRDVSLVME